MINISNSLKQACNDDKITYREYVVLKGTTAQIDVKTEMYATAYKDTHFIGTFNMKYIKFTTSNDIQYRNKELTLYKEINGESFKVGKFIVTEIKDNDSNEEVTVTAYDYGLKFAQPYQTSLNYTNGKITLKDVLDEICSNVVVELENEAITNGDFIVDSNQFVNGEMYGDVISAIAYLSGDFATINNNDKLEFIFTKKTNEIIEDYVELEDKRDTRPITSLGIGTSQVQGQSAVIKDQSLIDQYGEHWLIINDVPFAYTLEKREQLKTAIFNKVKGFGYSSFKSEYSFKPYYTLGDLVQFRNKDGDLVNSIILRITSKYDNIILEAPSVTDATIEYEMPQTSYDIAKRAEIIANQNTAEINAIAIETSENSNQIAQLHIDVNEIRGEIGDVTDITVTEEGYGILNFENINQSEPININIHAGSTNDISYLYPKNSLYPSNTLYLKDRLLQFTNTETNEIVNYILPADLRYFEGEYDELVMDYENQICQVTRRIGVNNDGSKYILNTEKIENYAYPIIPLTTGNYTIKMLNCSDAYMKIRLMSQNMYTSQFATRVEMNNKITQSITDSENKITSEIANTYTTKGETTTLSNAINQRITNEVNEIDLAVSEKANSSDVNASLNLKVSKNDNNQVVSMINASANVVNLNGNRVTINSNNFKLDTNGNMTCKNADISGIVKSSEGSIGGWAINGNGLTNGVVKLNSDGSSTIYTVADLIIIRNYIMGKSDFSLPQQMIRHYDMNGDGVVNTQDYVLLQNLIGISMN